VDQFKVVMKNMNGEPLLPGDDGFGDGDEAPTGAKATEPKAKPAHKH
jgi:hypothetical protein